MPGHLRLEATLEAPSQGVSPGGLKMQDSFLTIGSQSNTIGATTSRMWLHNL